MCSVPFGLVAALGRVAALNDGALGGIALNGRRGRVGPDDLAGGRRIWLGLAVAALHDLRLAVAGLHHGALGRVAALGLDVALLDLGLDDGRRVDDGGRVGQLRLSFFLVLLV